MRILYVEDEQFLAEAVMHVLEKNKISVDHAADGEEGLELAMKPNYDCVVLDIMLPKLSGLEILSTMRARGVKTPVIMLSALSEVEDKVRGLEKGADDYLAKPFKTVGLIARINALCRRPVEMEKKILEFGDLRFDTDNRIVFTSFTNSESGIVLTDKEAGILEMLMKNSAGTLTKQQILAHVWGVEAGMDENYVEVYVSYLRKKMEKVGSKVKIKTVRGLGYKIIEG
ncbi:response regulator transcription factor [Candidatus Saccharibacteria bacterium]|nr:response regulator transcription factor [Candidatus Saccharibacteria bacterium]